MAARPQDRPHHGQGRGRCLHGYARSVASRCAGHEEILDRDDPRGDLHVSKRAPTPQRKRFSRCPLRQRQRFGLAPCPRGLRMGVPVSSRNIFPSNIQGLPTWFKVPICEDLATRRPRRLRPHGGDESGKPGTRTWPASEPGGYLLNDFHEADAGVEIPRPYFCHRRAADRHLPTANSPPCVSASCSRISFTPRGRRRRPSASSRT